MKKTLAAMALVVIFTLALAVPVFGAPDMSYEGSFMFDGTIDFKTTAGHWCNTGAQMEQRISGVGTMEKTMDIHMQEGKIAVSDYNEWVTAPNAVRNLAVTTAIKLCAPPKYEVYDDATGEWGVADLVGNDGVYDDGALNADINDSTMFKPLSAQIWAVHVSANPGFSGQINMDFEAANSNKVFANRAAANADDDAYNSAWFGRPADLGDLWPGYTTVSRGPWYPGSYFNIDQFSRTSSGDHRRYIDISSPWSHGYLKEDMKVLGMSEVWEAFSMENVAAGTETAVVWWNLF